MSKTLSSLWIIIIQKTNLLHDKYELIFGVAKFIISVILIVYIELAYHDNRKYTYNRYYSVSNENWSKCIEYTVKCFHC
jgi:hypothetical protein